MAAPLLHHSVHRVKVGQSFRFEIEYAPVDSPEQYAASPPPSLWVRVRNTEPIPMRAAYLAGPYVLYVDCRPHEYEMHAKAFVTADQPVFELQLLPGQAFWAELLCHTFRPKYRWTVDVVSQILFNNTIATNFEVCIAAARDMAEHVVPAPLLAVSIHDTLDLWNLPVPDTSRPVHLVVLTHGLHLNVSADMMFLKEQIDRLPENVVVKGFFGNVCKTEKGIKYLGSRVAEYVVLLVRGGALGSVSKVSFIGHSLGGLVQTFAVAYLQSNYPWFFEEITPVNFITLASPMLGVTHENPAYIKLALLAGAVGRTGQELGLQLTEEGKKPLLLLLPSGPTHTVLKRFVRRTVYANVVNDGIVPLRTSALLYLDYNGLSQLVRPGEKVADDAKIPPRLPEEDHTLALLAMLSFFMPQKQKDTHSSTDLPRKSSADSPKKPSRPKDPYGRFQTNSETDSAESGSLLDRPLEHIPKPSMIESATSLILPPVPSMRYITDPGARDDVILHDKVYHEQDLPASEKAPTTVGDQKKSMMQMINEKRDEFRLLIGDNITEHYEEEIAREYHKLMLWRKVLVNIKPDAHNNIVVRRRFANAYGWPVIEHLVQNHFGHEETFTAKEATNEELEPQVEMLSADMSRSNDDSLDHSSDGMELTKILSRDMLNQQNQELDLEPDENTWINTKGNTGGFVGPTGLLSEVSEIMFRFKEQLSNYGANAAPESSTSMKEPPERLIGEFI